MAKSDLSVDQVQVAQVKTDKEIASGYTGAVGSIDKAIEHLSGLKDALRQQGTQAGEVGEERRRAHDKAMYDLAKERQAVKDAQDREDAEREARFKVREADLRGAEDELLGALEVPREASTGGVPAVRVIRAAFDRKVTEAVSAGEAAGRASAEREYQTQKRIDAAEASKDKALLEQEVETLRTRNAALEEQNRALIAAQQKTVDHMKDVAQGAFQAAGGVVRQGNEALGSAALGGGPRVRT